MNERDRDSASLSTLAMRDQSAGLLVEVGDLERKCESSVTVDISV